MISLERELAAERVRLGGLINETEAAIGRVARKGYRGLNKLPTDDRPIYASASGPFATDTRFFRDRRIVRAATLPRDPVRVEGMTIKKTATETYRKVHYKGGKRTLQLPAQNKLVVVEFDDPRHPHSFVPSSASISTKGYAEYNGHTDRTSPLVLDGDLAGTCMRGYDSAEGLRGNYARSFTSALTVAGFVADTLTEVHDIEVDTTALGEIADAWRQAAPGAELPPDANMATFLAR